MEQGVAWARNYDLVVTSVKDIEATVKILCERHDKTETRAALMELPARFELGWLPRFSVLMPWIDDGPFKFHLVGHGERQT